MSPYLDNLHDYELGFFNQLSGKYESFTVTSLSASDALIAGFNCMQNARFLDHGVFNIVSVKPPTKDIPT